MAKIKTLFVCRGNTCRSPLSESLFNEILDANPFLFSIFEYAKSAGVQIWRDQVSNGAMKIGALHGLTKRMKAHSCTQFEESTYNDFDFILCMDSKNKDLLRQFAGEKIMNKTENLKKVKYLRSFDPDSDEIEIDDPIGADLSCYESTYQQILTCISQYILTNMNETKFGCFPRLNQNPNKLDISKFAKSGFSTSKKSIIFVCRDNRYVSPLCETIFNKKLKNSSNLSEKYNIASSVSTSQSEWGNSCNEQLINFMDEKHNLDLSMHETDSFSGDVFDNDVIVPVGSNACNLVNYNVKKFRKSENLQTSVLALVDFCRDNKDIELPDSRSGESLERFYRECEFAVENLFGYLEGSN